MNLRHLFLHPDCTVGSGIAPNQPQKALGLVASAHYRQWGITPRPKTNLSILYEDLSALSTIFRKMSKKIKNLFSF